MLFLRAERYMNLCTYLRTSILRCGLLCWSCHKRGLLGLEIWCPFQNYVWRLPPDYLSYMLYSCYLSYMLWLWSINLRNMDHLAHHSQIIYDDAPLKDCDFFIVTLNNQEVSKNWPFHSLYLALVVSGTPGSPLIPPPWCLSASMLKSPRGHFGSAGAGHR